MSAARPSLSGRIASTFASLDALEDAIRAQADEERARARAVPGTDDGTEPGWAQLERAADAVMSAVSSVRLARSYVRGAILRGAEIP